MTSNLEIEVEKGKKSSKIKKKTGSEEKRERDRREQI